MRPLPDVLSSAAGFLAMLTAPARLEDRPQVKSRSGDVVLDVMVDHGQGLAQWGGSRLVVGGQWS
jgi:hypothetical protein